MHLTWPGTFVDAILPPPAGRPAVGVVSSEGVTARRARRVETWAVQLGAQRPSAMTCAPSRSPSSRPPPRDRSRPDPRGGRARLVFLLPALALLLGALHPFAATAQEIVAADWACIPKDSNNNPLVTGGQSFRLLFITSTRTQATSTEISTYNSFVQARAATNNCFTTARANKFKAFISTASNPVTHAKANTATTGTGVPIYWMKGAKVADN